MEENINQSSADILHTSLLIQDQCFQEWYSQDSSSLKLYKINQDFTSSEFDPAGWKRKDFTADGHYNTSFHPSGQWTDIQPCCKTDGLEIQNSLIKVPGRVLLRSLAVETRFRVQLDLHSRLIIFTRVLNEITSDVPVMNIVKDSTLKGLFFLFGCMEAGSQRFKLIKQNQIKELEKTDSQSKELDVSILDNGDDKIYVSTTSSNQAVQDFHYVVSGFIPQVEKSQIWIAATGDRVLLKSLSVQYRERIRPITNIIKSDHCVCFIN